MSFPTRKFKPKISRVRSSHSGASQAVKIMRCPPVHDPPAEKVEDVPLNTARTSSNKQKKSRKKAAKNPSSPKNKLGKPSEPKLHYGLKIGESDVLKGNFLEEMKAGLDEMGEKLRKVEKELASQNHSPLLTEKRRKPQVEKEAQIPNSVLAYDPIEFTDMDFNVGVPVDAEDSYDYETSSDSKKIGYPTKKIVEPSNEAVESVISKIRDDIRKWRTTKGVPDALNEENPSEPSVVSNGHGGIVVREDAERETPYESNRCLYIS